MKSARRRGPSLPKQPLRETHMNVEDKNRQNLNELMVLGRIKRERELAPASRAYATGDSRGRAACRGRQPRRAP